MYIIGGSFADFLYNDVWYYDFLNSIWTEVNAKGQLPAPREGFSALNINSRFVYLYGGWDGEREIPYNEHFLFDMNTEYWI